MPPIMPNTTKAPTARKAMSFTIDSTAIARIMPSWCSVVSMWRVPNRMAKTPMVSTTNSDNPSSPVEGVRMSRVHCGSETSAPSATATALSWIEM